MARAIHTMEDVTDLLGDTVKITQHFAAETDGFTRQPTVVAGVLTGVRFEAFLMVSVGAFLSQVPLDGTAVIQPI